jgi:serine/threonine protein kinase
LIKLQEYGKTHPEEIKEVNGVRFCGSQKFLIGKGGDGTRVYVGLGKDGYERAVKRFPRDLCACVAEHEKKVLNELNTTQSNYVVRYWFLDDENDNEWLFLILDLCEETLIHFVNRSSLEDLAKNVRTIFQQVLKGLSDLHCDPKPVLHRDLKPSNILRDVHGNWLLADFGISRILTTSDSTHLSEQRGTEDWRAVESYPQNGMTDDGIVRYKKESDIQVGFCW